MSRLRTDGRNCEYRARIRKAGFAITFGQFFLLPKVNLFWCALGHIIDSRKKSEGQTVSSKGIQKVYKSGIQKNTRNIDARKLERLDQN